MRYFLWNIGNDSVASYRSSYIGFCRLVILGTETIRASSIQFIDFPILEYHSADSTGGNQRSGSLIYACLPSDKIVSKMGGGGLSVGEGPVWFIIWTVTAYLGSFNDQIFVVHAQVFLRLFFRIFFNGLRERSVLSLKHEKVFIQDEKSLPVLTLWNEGNQVGINWSRTREWSIFQSQLILFKNGETREHRTKHSFCYPRNLCNIQGDDFHALCKIFSVKITLLPPTNYKITSDSLQIGAYTEQIFWFFGYAIRSPICTFSLGRQQRINRGFVFWPAGTVIRCVVFIFGSGVHDLSVSNPSADNFLPYRGLFSSIVLFSCVTAVNVSMYPYFSVAQQNETTFFHFFMVLHYGWEIFGL